MIYVKDNDFLEGDFIEDINGIIFDVKGFEHPPDKVVAYPRYIPDKMGDRCGLRGRYRKIYDINERISYLEKRFREYIVYDDVFDCIMCEVPRKKIVRHYKPEETLKLLGKGFYCLSRVEKDAYNLIKLLSKETGISFKFFGISGSIMVGLHSENSDIDIVVYGNDTSWSVIKALSRLFKNKVLRRTSEDKLKRLYYERKIYKIMDFETYRLHEYRKMQEGNFGGRDFFIRFIRDCDQHHKYGFFRYKNIGRIKAKVKIIDDYESIFTPAKYIVKILEIIEDDLIEEIDVNKEFWIYSFRGRYCQQAFSGEVTEVAGKIEKVIKNEDLVAYRILLSKDGEDYMISNNLIENKQLLDFSAL